MGGHTYTYAEILAPDRNALMSYSVDAWVPSGGGGLVIHRGIGEDIGRWVVAHQSSGLAIGYHGCATFSEAEALLVALIPLTDWTASRQAVVAAIDRGALTAVLEARGVHTCRHICHPDRPGSNECRACGQEATR